MKVTTSIVKTLTSTHIKFVYRNLKIDMCKPIIVEHIFEDTPPKKEDRNEELNFRMVNKIIEPFRRYQDEERKILEEHIASA